VVRSICPSIWNEQIKLFYSHCTLAESNAFSSSLIFRLFDINCRGNIWRLTSWGIHWSCWFKRILWHKQTFGYSKTFPPVRTRVSFIGHAETTNFASSESLNSFGFHCSQSGNRYPRCIPQKIFRSILDKYLTITIFSLTYNNNTGDVYEEDLFLFIDCCFSTIPHSPRQALEILRKYGKLHEININ